MGRLTTHVLDTAHGRPAAGVRIGLDRLGSGAPVRVAESVTNADGRCDGPLLEGDGFVAGAYRLEFHVGAYFAEAGAAAGFLDVVPVRFAVADPAQHYHVPLLISPFGYTTYRGS